MTGSRQSLTGMGRWRTSATTISSLSSSPLLPGTIPRWCGQSQTRWGAGQHHIKMAAGSPHSMSATMGQMVTLSKARCTNRAQLALPVERDSSAQLNMKDFAVIIFCYDLLNKTSLSQ